MSSSLSTAKRPQCFSGASLPVITFSDDQCNGLSYYNGNSIISYVAYENITTQLVGGNCIVPVDEQSTNLPCSCSAPSSSAADNCFIATSCSYTASICEGMPSGWKAIRASKVWQGTLGPLEGCTCSSASVKYLTTNRKIKGTMKQLNIHGGYDSYTLDWQRQYTVNHNSGRVTQDICIDTWTPSPGNIDNSSMPINYNFIQMIMACGTPPGTFTPIGDGWYLYNSVPVDGINTWSSSISISAGGFSITMKGPPESSIALYNWNGNITFTNTLSNPYSLSDVEQDAIGLVNYWDLSNNTLIPWRTDNACTIVPVVKRDEGAAVSPESFIRPWLGCADFTDGMTFTGAVKGAPLPLGYGLVCSSSGHHPGYYNFTILSHLAPNQYGQWNSDYGVELPPWATNWSDAQEQVSFYNGAFNFIDANETYHVQKYAAVQDIVPSFDYPCRPCGKDRFLPDQVDKFCVSTTDPPTLTITLSLPPTGWAHDDLLALCGVIDFPDGVWKLDTIAGSTIVVQDSSSFFIPHSYTICDAQGNVSKILYQNSSAICGITKIVNVTKTGSYVTMSVADNQDYLYPSDCVGFMNDNGFVVSDDFVTVNSVINSTTFTYAGNIPSFEAVYAKSCGGYGFPSDVESKGDFVFLKWNYSVCDFVEHFSCSQACGDVTNPCSPPIMSVLPPGSIENFGNATTLTMELISTHDKRWFGMPVGNIVDPLWQPMLTCYGDPAAQCQGGSPPVECLPTYVEARCDVPTLNGIKLELPIGRSLGCWDLPVPLTCGSPALNDCSTYRESQEYGI